VGIDVDFVPAFVSCDCMRDGDERATWGRRATCRSRMRAERSRDEYRVPW